VGAVRESASLGIRRSVEGPSEHEAKFSFPAALKDATVAAATPTGIALVQVSLYCQDHNQCCYTAYYCILLHKTDSTSKSSKHVISPAYQ
jgi:hypothetical protein